MAKELRGSVYATATGYGIRWREHGKRRFQSGFRTKTEAREWFDATVKPRSRAGAPDTSITFDDFAALYIERHGATVSKRTRETIEERLAPSRARFGTWTL